MEGFCQCITQILISVSVRFYEYMKSNGVSESHQNNNLKMLIAFARYLGALSFVDINTNESITDFLNSKLKSIEDDPDKKCLTTWNDYLGRLKYFFRWLHNCKKNSGNNTNTNKNLYAISQSEWETPAFVKIKEKIFWTVVDSLIGIFE